MTFLLGVVYGVCVIPSSDRVFAWCTPPAVERVYYAQTDEWTYASNWHPAIALSRCAGDFDLIQMDDEFIYHYLIFGFSIGESTPFKGIRILRPSTSLGVCNGEISIHKVPDFGDIHLLEREDERERGVEELKVQLLDATQLLLHQRPDTPIQLRISGAGTRGQFWVFSAISQKLPLFA